MVISCIQYFQGWSITSLNWQPTYCQRRCDNNTSCYTCGDFQEWTHKSYKNKSIHPLLHRRSKWKSFKRSDYTAPTKDYAVQYLVLQESIKNLLHINNDIVKEESLNTLLQGTLADTWGTSLSNELVRLSQGIRNVKVNDVIDFISHKEVPTNKKVTYASMVYDYRPFKSDPHRVSLTVSGEWLEYLLDTSSPAASLIETKLLLNSVISDAKHGSGFMTTDIKDFFLQTKMQDAEYMRIH